VSAVRGPGRDLHQGTASQASDLFVFPFVYFVSLVVKKSFFRFITLGGYHRYELDVEDESETVPLFWEDCPKSCSSVL
jgi:hypothetical protein